MDGLAPSTLTFSVDPAELALDAAVAYGLLLVVLLLHAAKTNMTAMNSVARLACISPPRLLAGLPQRFVNTRCHRRAIRYEHFTAFLWRYEGDLLKCCSVAVELC